MNCSTGDIYTKQIGGLLFFNAIAFVESAMAHNPCYHIRAIASLLALTLFLFCMQTQYIPHRPFDLTYAQA